MDDFVRIRATESTLAHHHFASLGEAQERLSSEDFDQLMREITAATTVHLSAQVAARRKPSWWDRRRSRS